MGSENSLGSFRGQWEKLEEHFYLVWGSGIISGRVQIDLGIISESVIISGRVHAAQCDVVAPTLCWAGVCAVELVVQQLLRRAVEIG